MVDILNIPELGKLEIVEVYEYYDQPILYSCKNASEHFYLVVAAAEDDQFLTWLCVAVSRERLNLIRSGTIDLHDAFADSENPYAIQVRVPYEEHASVQRYFVQSNRMDCFFCCVFVANPLLWSLVVFLPMWYRNILSLSPVMVAVSKALG